MNLEIQFKIKQNPYYISYLRSHSYWYKILSREPMKLKEFENNAKQFYKLRKSDKLSKTLEYIEIFQSIMEQM